MFPILNSLPCAVTVSEGDLERELSDVVEGEGLTFVTGSMGCWFSLVMVIFSIKILDLN